MTRTAAILVTAACCLTLVTLEAFDQTLDATAIAEAIDIGQTRLEALRVKFHKPYRIDVSRPPVDYVDVVTPFRRIALEADARIHAGEHLYGQREARATLGELPEQVDLLVELTFHPQNTFIGVPPYQLTLVPAGGGSPIPPRDVARVPRYGFRVQGMPLPYPYMASAPIRRGSEPLMGGTLIMQIDGRALNRSGIYDMLVTESGKEVARARVDFGTLR